MIVPMRVEHTARLAELERICFAEPWSEVALNEETENPTAYFVVAVEGDEVLGYAGMHRVLGESYIDNIAVFPQYRGKGIGRELTSALIERAGEDDGEFITLEVRVSNAAAIGLYESLGFERSGVRRRFYRNPTEDALIMTLGFN